MRPAAAASIRALVRNRAQRSTQIIERLELHPEGLRQSAQIDFFAQRAPGDQHTVGADPKHRRALLRGLEHVGGE
jgi:hypothetical protein